MKKRILDQCVVMIISHGRPENQLTYKSLRRAGYTGPIIIVIDNQDKTGEEYKRLYGEAVAVFDKEKEAETTDAMDNFSDYRACVWARNACFWIAKDKGYKYFIQLDDDYASYQYRFDEKLEYNPICLKKLDDVFEHLLEFYRGTSILSLGIAQGGDFIGGEDCSRAQNIQAWRKVMNFFILSPDRPFKFRGRMNDDVNSYTRLGETGNLFISTNQVNTVPSVTQELSGGMTEIYLSRGTYVKTFYSVMQCPSSIKISTITGQSGAQRIHHRVDWGTMVPKILRESVKK